jgi:hypothetical protein
VFRRGCKDGMIYLCAMQVQLSSFTLKYLRLNRSILLCTRGYQFETRSKWSWKEREIDEEYELFLLVWEGDLVCGADDPRSPTCDMISGA